MVSTRISELSVRSFLLIITCRPHFRLLFLFSLSPDIYIPPEQIIDTVNIYHLSHRQRKLSLRFLAWAVLHSDIQTDTHDSIEDARTALQLYEEYNRLEAQGTWEDALEDVYREGKQTVRFFLPCSFCTCGNWLHPSIRA